MSDPDFDFMEDFTRRSLGTLPARRAPVSLEAGVRIRLEAASRRPSPLRPLAVVLSALAAAAFVAVPALLARHGGTGSVVDLLAGRFGWIAAAQGLWMTLREVADGVRLALPESWFAWGLAALALAYAALAGLGTAAYRLFFRPSRKSWAALT
ncbi:MAG TPA: hypothetical protein VHV47_14125 [Opitutaceae bacterium]|jgi:hypothetical protein|nr:hypothetical protein [Opitutaceae bacterium]